MFLPRKSVPMFIKLSPAVALSLLTYHAKRDRQAQKKMGMIPSTLAKLTVGYCPTEHVVSQQEKQYKNMSEFKYIEIHIYICVCVPIYI